MRYPLLRSFVRVGNWSGFFLGGRSEVEWEGRDEGSGSSKNAIASSESEKQERLLALTRTHSHTHTHAHTHTHIHTHTDTSGAKLKKNPRSSVHACRSRRHRDRHGARQVRTQLKLRGTDMFSKKPTLCVENGLKQYMRFLRNK